MIETIKFGTLNWSHIVRPTEEDLQTLSDTYHFHPLDIEDCRSVTNLRPKIDTYEDYYFLVLHFPSLDATNTFVDAKEIKVFWGQDFLITIGRSHWIVKELFTKEKNKVIAGVKVEAGSSDALLYRILDYLMKETQTLVDKIDKDVDNCGKSLFARKTEKIIEKITITRKNVILLNTMFKPELQVFNKLQSGTIKGFAKDMEDYWGNILDYFQKVMDIVEDDAELIRGYSMTFDSMQVDRTNKTLKILTLFSTILLPLILMANIFSMNINLPVQTNPHSFTILVVVMLAIAFVTVIYLRMKKWF
ncbi:MAG: magnesium transporter CorA family protein [Bacteroidetes bacterium]|nr:magnesium transporter CorA family protein [Bacteroidota bacterium]